MLQHSCKVYQGPGPGIDLQGSVSQTVRCPSRSVHLVGLLFAIFVSCLLTCWTVQSPRNAGELCAMYCHAITVNELFFQLHLH